MTWRLVGGALVVLALAVGLAVTLSQPDERAAPPPTDAVPNETVPSTTRPPLNAEAIWVELLTIHNRAFQAPAEADLSRYLSTRCPCLQPLQERIDFLAANRWREDDAGVVFESLDITAQSAGAMSLLVRDRHVELRVVDEAGTVVEQASARPLTEWHVDLALEPDGWRILRWDVASAPG